MSFEPTQPMPIRPPGRQEEPQDTGSPQPRRPRRRRPVRRTVISVFIILVVAVLLLIGDRVGNLVAENDMADQFTSNGFPVKPSVNIEGFPFLTQVVMRDFRRVDISASNIPAGPVTITSLHATLKGMHLSSSFNSATIDSITATAFVSFGSLTTAGGLGAVAGVVATQVGPDKLKVTATVLGQSIGSEEAVIKQTGPQQITVQVLDGGGLGGILGSTLGSFSTFSFKLPAGVPPSLRITGLTLNPTGLTLSAAATNAKFSKP
jgi:hypothetical protein